MWSASFSAQLWAPGLAAPGVPGSRLPKPWAGPPVEAASGVRQTEGEAGVSEPSPSLRQSCSPPRGSTDMVPRPRLVPQSELGTLSPAGTRWWHCRPNSPRPRAGSRRSSQSRSLSAAVQRFISHINRNRLIPPQFKASAQEARSHGIRLSIRAWEAARSVQWNRCVTGSPSLGRQLRVLGADGAGRVSCVRPATFWSETVSRAPRGLTFTPTQLRGAAASRFTAEGARHESSVTRRGRGGTRPAGTPSGCTSKGRRKEVRETTCKPILWHETRPVNCKVVLWFQDTHACRLSAQKCTGGTDPSAGQGGRVQRPRAARRRCMCTPSRLPDCVL